jgi:hypothetical protein
MKTQTRFVFLSILLGATLVLSIFASNAFAQTGSPGVSSTAPAIARARQPIPMRWKIAVIAAAAAVGLAVLAFAAPRWRSSNLFDRQYRFPRVENVALRFGATRSGGCMATIEYRRESTSEHT